jgi:hypothetical protein
MLNGEQRHKGGSEVARLVARDSSGKIALFDWEATSLRRKTWLPAFRDPTMGLREISQRLGKLYCRLVMSKVEYVPEWKQTSEFDCRAMACDWNEPRGSEQRLVTPREVQGQQAASLPNSQRRADVPAGARTPANKRVTTSDVARGVLGANSAATISNVLVLGTEGSTPLKRMEIHFEDPKQVPSMLKLLAVALQTNGFDFRAVRNPGIPTTEIWLSTPLDDGKKTLLSCAAPVGEQVVERVALQAGSPRNQTQ